MITINVYCSNGFGKTMKSYQLSQMWDDLASQVWELIPAGLTPIYGEIIYPWGMREDLIF